MLFIQINPKWRHLLPIVFASGLLLMMGSSASASAISLDPQKHPTGTATKVVHTAAVYGGASSANKRRFITHRICTTRSYSWKFSSAPVARIERVTADGRPFTELRFALSESFSGRTYKVPGRFSCKEHPGRTLKVWSLPNMKSQLSRFVVPPEAPAKVTSNPAETSIDPGCTDCVNLPGNIPEGVVVIPDCVAVDPVTGQLTMVSCDPQVPPLTCSADAAPAVTTKGGAYYCPGVPAPPAPEGVAPNPQVPGGGSAG